MRDSKSMKSGILFTGLSLAALGISACSTYQKTPKDWITSPADANLASVDRSTDVLEISLPAAQTALYKEDRAELAAFVKRYMQVGVGDLIVTTPTGTANTQLAIQSLADLREIAFDSGLSYESIRVRTYDASGVSAAPMTLSFDRYVAVAPDCPLLSRVDLVNVRSNAEMPTIGCSVNTNLAAMVAKPEDLIRPEESTARGSVRTASQFDRYQAGESTTSASDLNASVE